MTPTELGKVASGKFARAKNPSPHASLSLSWPRPGMHHFCLETGGQTDMRSSLKVTGVAYITLENCRFLVLAAALQSCLSLINIIKWIFLGIHIYRVPPLPELSSLLLCYK